MNTLTKQLIGAGIGAAIGLFIAQVVIDYKELKRQKLENFDWLNGDEEDHGDLIVEPTVLDENSDKEIMQKGVKMSKNKIQNYTRYFNDQGRPDLAALADKYNTTDETVLTPDEADEELDIVIDPDDIGDELDNDDFEADSVDPRIIRMEDYADNGVLTHMTLSYYEDDIVTDERGNPIDKPERILGEEALISFGEMSNDPDIVYVQNLAKKAMYEVVRMNRPYMGVNDARLRTKKFLRKRSEEESNGKEEHS